MNMAGFFPYICAAAYAQIQSRKSLNITPLLTDPEIFT